MKLIGKKNTINEVDGSNKVDRAKFQIDFQAKLFKSKNIIRLFLIKFQLLAETNSRLSFLTFRVRLAFIKLRPAFIKISILHNFNLKYDIWIETNALNYVISGVLSQLTLNNLI